MPGPGDTWPVDNAWRQSVREDMRLAGMSMTELARRLGCGRTTLHALFAPAPGIRRSGLVAAIHALLGRPPPPMPIAPSTSEILLRSVTAMWPLLGDGDRELVTALVVSLIGRGVD